MDFYDIVSSNNYKLNYLLFSNCKNNIQEGFTSDVEIAQAKKKMDEIKQKLDQANKTLDSYEKEKKSADDLLTKLNDELNVLKNNQTSLDKTIQDIQNQISSIQKQINDLNQIVENKKTELTNKKNQLDYVNKVYNSINNNCNTNTPFGSWNSIWVGRSIVSRLCDPPKYDYKTKPTNNVQRKNELTNTSNNLKKEISKLENEIKTLIKNNEPKIKSFESTNAVNRKNLKNKQDEKDKNIKNKNNDIDNAKKKLDEITKKINDYKKTVDLKKLEEELKVAQTVVTDLEYAREMEKTKYFYTENYQLTAGSIQSCGFYFNSNNFKCLYSIITNDMNQYVEYNVIKNRKLYCFNIDENNKNILYSIVNNQLIHYIAIDKNTNNKYILRFNISLKNTHFINCLTKFMENSYKNNVLAFNLNSQTNTIELDIFNKKCILQLKNLNIHRTESSILSNTNINNINKIIYLDKEIDLNKKYSYGQLYYSPTQSYDCIVMNN
jgi:predicted  nucleic acid-binding Zn-ribbon protein